MDRKLIEDLLVKHEGRRNRVYPDSRGILTIGIGWNLEDPDSEVICSHFQLSLSDLRTGKVALTDSQIDEVFQYQVTDAVSSTMGVLPNFMAMPDAVQAVVVDMVFNLGITRFKKFHDTIASLKAGNWKGAATHAGQSLWAQQVPTRAKEDIAMLEAA